MILNDLWNLFERKLFQEKCEANLFNQYNDIDIDKRVDLPNAPKIRRENLKRYLESFTDKPTIFVVGEAPGPRGCRFSGVPFTCESQLLDKTFCFSGKQSSIEKPKIDTKNKKPPFTSNSSKTFWSIMKKHHQKFFVWNCVPFHPYKPDNILSIRTPTKEEIRDYSELLKEIVEIVTPTHKNIISVGRKAEKSLNLLNIKSTYVRHPARGGAKKFSKDINNFFNKISLD